MSIADQEAIELTLPLARERQMGVIAKRPLANAVWRHAQKPENAYVVPYWERIQELALRLPPGRSLGGGGHGAPIHAGRPGRAHGDRRHRPARTLAR